MRYFADAHLRDVRHHHGANRLERKTVVSLHDGYCGLIEIKLGGASFIERGTETLKKLASRIDTIQMAKLRF